jgi:hypothetical protein
MLLGWVIIEPNVLITSLTDICRLLSRSSPFSVVLLSSIFNRAKINYSFIFEFDTRHNLDWRQLSEV